MEIRVRKPKIRKILTPDQLKFRSEISFYGSIASALFPLVEPSSLALSAVVATGLALYHRTITSRLEKTRIGHAREGEQVYLDVGIDEIGRKVQITDYYFHRHMLVVGGTGMGKTSLYRKIIGDALERNFGIIYINFKAEDEDFFNLYAIAQEKECEKDLLLVNFAPSASQTGETATYNPLATLETPQQIADFFFNLLAPAQGDMAYWQGRGRNLMNASSRVFVFLRDFKKQPPDLKLFLRSFELSEIAQAYHDPQLPQDFKVWIETYLQDIDPAGTIRKSGSMRIPPEMLNQHGYALQQWKEAIMDIALRYSHIFDTDQPDVDFADVVRNSRILYVHMPALALPDSTKEALGRLILAGLKTAVSSMLGERLFGSVEELKKIKKKEKPKNPFLIIIDEHGTAPVVGIDDFIRQIRSLGGGAIIADQNWDGIKQKFGDGYLNTLLGNSLTKIIMNVEGSSAVVGYLESRIPKIKTILPSYRKVDLFYEQTDTTQLQDEPLVKTEELMKLDRGEGYVIQGEKIIKTKFHWYKPELKGKEVKLFINSAEKVKYAEKLLEMLNQIELKQVEKLPEDLEQKEELEDVVDDEVSRFKKYVASVILILNEIKENATREEKILLYTEAVADLMREASEKKIPKKVVIEEVEPLAEKIFNRILKELSPEKQKQIVSSLEKLKNTTAVPYTEACLQIYTFAKKLKKKEADSENKS